MMTTEAPSRGQCNVERMAEKATTRPPQEALRVGTLRGGTPPLGDIVASQRDGIPEGMQPSDVLFTLHRVASWARATQTQLHVAKLDVRKAFDATILNLAKEAAERFAGAARAWCANAKPAAA